ncbi:MAG: MGMT family protein [Actinobacteria bacterium]|nr:MGMT family protein [Actinomycetota bacterium]
MLHSAIHKTPIGELSIIVEEHVLLAAGFKSLENLLVRLSPEDADKEIKHIGKIPVIVMRKIPAGKTLSYAELAKRAGSADAIRAAGTACGNNLIAPIIPCHRIIKSGGALGNYGYGIKVKEWLLTHEGAL